MIKDIISRGGLDFFLQNRWHQFIFFTHFIFLELGTHKTNKFNEMLDMAAVKNERGNNLKVKNSKKR